MYNLLCDTSDTKKSQDMTRLCDQVLFNNSTYEAFLKIMMKFAS